MHGLEKVGGLSVGSLIAGKYRVDRVLGKGGMGVVVAATHLDLLEPRAIKVMIASAAADPELSQRFINEARIASRLHSEHAVKVHDVGRLDHGVPYMVMEQLQGCDLRAVRKQYGTLPVDEAALYVIQACDALAEAHAQGLIHRDIKPSNLFLTRGPDGSPCVKLLDFGISKLPERGSASSDGGVLTGTGQMLGTPHFMPPEQMLAQRDIDPRADIWALGVLLYLLVTGHYPVEASAFEIVGIVLSGEYDPPPPSQIRRDLPTALDPVILRCIQSDRTKRPPNVAELARALLPFAPASAQPLVERIGRLLGVPWVEPVRIGAGVDLPQFDPDDSYQSLVPSRSTSISGAMAVDQSGPTLVRPLSLGLDAQPLEALEWTDPDESDRRAVMTLTGGTMTRTTTRWTPLPTSTKPARPRRFGSLLWGSLGALAATMAAFVVFAMRPVPGGAAEQRSAVEPGSVIEPNVGASVGAFRGATRPAEPAQTAASAVAAVTGRRVALAQVDEPRGRGEGAGTTLAAAAEAPVPATASPARPLAAPPTDAPSTDAPSTDAPSTDAPSTDAPSTDAPSTDAPSTDARAPAPGRTFAARPAPRSAPARVDTRKKPRPNEVTFRDL